MAGTEDGLERPVVEASDFPQGFNVMLVATAVEHGQQGEAPPREVAPRKENGAMLCVPQPRALTTWPARE